MITSRLITTDCDPYFSQNLPINFPSRQLPGYFARQCIIVWHVSGFGTSSKSRFRDEEKTGSHRSGGDVLGGRKSQQ